jgi:3-oxoadipate enol-lactonase
MVSSFDSDGVPIHYEVFGRGEPIILVHGLASSLKGNWMDTGWIEALSPIRQVVALDCRGRMVRRRISTAVVTP